MWSLETMIPKHSASLKPVGLKQSAVVQLIRELRPRIQLIQEQFATVLVVTYSTLSRWGNGHMLLVLKQIQFVMHQVKNAPAPPFRDKDKLLFDKYFLEEGQKL